MWWWWWIGKYSGLDTWLGPKFISIFFIFITIERGLIFSNFSKDLKKVSLDNILYSIWIFQLSNWDSLSGELKVTQQMIFDWRNLKCKSIPPLSSCLTQSGRERLRSTSGFGSVTATGGRVERSQCGSQSLRSHHSRHTSLSCSLMSTTTRRIYRRNSMTRVYSG